MYSYRNIHTGEVRRFITLQRYPWQIVDTHDDSTDSFFGIAAITQQSFYNTDDDSNDPADFTGGGGSGGGGGASDRW